MLSDHLNNRLFMQNVGEQVDKAAGAAMPVNSSAASLAGIRRPFSESDEDTNSSNTRKRAKKNTDNIVEDSKPAAGDGASSLLNLTVLVDPDSPEAKDAAGIATASDANAQLEEAQRRLQAGQGGAFAGHDLTAHQGLLQGLGGGVTTHALHGNPLPNIDSIQGYASVQPTYLLQQNQGLSDNSQGYPGYLQGYLNGLQQAKASSTNRQSLMEQAALPQGNYPQPFVPSGLSQATMQPDLALYLAAGRNQNLSGLGMTPLGGNPFLASLPPTQLGFLGQDPLLGSMLGSSPSLSQSLHTLGLGGLHQVSGNTNAYLNQTSLGQRGELVGAAPAGATAADGYPVCLPVSLSRSDDSQNLTSHQILLREQIEVFEATEQDANTHTRGRNKPIMVGQVGVRCKHCKHVSILQRQKGYTYFPNSMLGIYQAAQNMNTVHMQCGLCSEMPEEVKKQFVHSMCYSKVHQSGAGRQYWARAAKKLGLVDTESHGIRFIRNVPQGAKVVDE